MEGTIIHFRGSYKTKRLHPRQMVICIDGVESKDNAVKLVGKEVVWYAPGKAKKQIKGKITASHGSKGVVKVTFERGMPGQSLGTKVKVM